MKVDIWMPIYINDYLADTMRLSAEKHGVYLLLMMDYWKHGKLTADIDELSFIARVQSDNKSLLYILENFFTLNGDKYTHSRINKELGLANSRRETAKENGKKGGRPPKNNNPEETHGLNGGKPTDNQQGNPQESSSSSSSSSQLSTSPNNKEGDKSPKRKRFTPDLSFIDNDEIKPIFEKWCKGKSKKYKNQIQVESGYNKLCKLSSNNHVDAYEIVEYSLSGNYEGLFALKGKTHAQDETTEEELDAIWK